MTSLRGHSLLKLTEKDTLVTLKKLRALVQEIHINDKYLTRLMRNHSALMTKTVFPKLQYYFFSELNK